MSKQLKLIRYSSLPDCTLGILLGDGVAWDTIERPWFNNEPNISCIPEGSYRITRDLTGKHKVYALHNVPERSAIEIHPANRAIELNGCIALGNQRGMLHGDHAVLRSSEAIFDFLSFMGGEPGSLEIMHF